jgi:hypothetical protein
MEDIFETTIKVSRDGRVALFESNSRKATLRLVKTDIHGSTFEFCRDAQRFEIFGTLKPTKADGLLAFWGTDLQSGKSITFSRDFSQDESDWLGDAIRALIHLHRDALNMLASPS